MLAIAATPPPSGPPDLSSPRFAGAKKDRFAPVLADAARVRDAGSDLPSTGTEAPHRRQGPDRANLSHRPPATVRECDDQASAPTAREDRDDDDERVAAGPAAAPASPLPPVQPAPAILPPAPLKSDAPPIDSAIVPAPPAIASGGAESIPGTALDPLASPEPMFAETGPIAPAAAPDALSALAATIRALAASEGSPRAEPVRADLPAATDTPPTGGAAALPALQTFGAALHRAAIVERRRIDGDGEPQPAAPGASALPVPLVVAITPGEGGALDLRQQRWPDTMIARIEQLRDAHAAPGSAADTRIRLYPEALGVIDVTLRQDGAATHVRLHAAEAATRALLADAQPRLQELAETRGLRLATDIGGGNTQGSAGHDRRQPAPAPTDTPVHGPAAAPVADDPADTRIA